MVFTSAVCFVLALSTTFATNQTAVDQLKDEIESSVAGEMVKVAKVFNGSDSQKLQDEMLNTLGEGLKRLEPQIKELRQLSGNQTDRVAEDLTDRINKDLTDDLPDGANITSRGLAKKFLRVGKTIGVKAGPVLKKVVPVAIKHAPKVIDDLTSNKKKK